MNSVWSRLVGAKLADNSNVKNRFVHPFVLYLYNHAVTNGNAGSKQQTRCNMINREVEAFVCLPDDFTDGFRKYLNGEGNHLVVRYVSRNDAVFLAFEKEAVKTNGARTLEELIKLLPVVGLILVLAELRDFIQNLISCFSQIA